MAKDLEVRIPFKAVDKTSRITSRIHTRLSRMLGGLTRGFRKLDRVASKVANTVTGALKYGFATGAAAATGLFLAINSTAESMDALAKKTRAIDFPIEEFQEWRFAAEQSGISGDVFEKSVTKFTKTIGEMKGGYGALFTALKKSDRPLLKQLKNTKNVSEALELYLAAIRKQPGAMKKAALASAGFGRDGVDMINLAMNSTEALEDLRAQMRENGVVTAEQAAKAEEYNDMMNRVKLTLQGFLVGVLTPLMPIMTELLGKLREWAVANRGVIASKIQEYLQWLIKNFKLVIAWVKKVGMIIGIFFGLVVAIKAVTAVLTLMNLVAAANPIVLIVMAVIAAIALIVIFRKEIMAFIMAVVEYHKEALAQIGNFFQGIWERIVSIFESIKAFVMLFVETIQDTFGLFFDVWTGDWESAGERIIRIWTNIKKMASTVIDWVTSHVKGLLSVVGKVADALGFGSDSSTPAPASTGSVPTMAPASAPAVRPTVSLDQKSSESVTKEESEITIKDETGRAVQTKGKKNKKLKLVHTGGML